MDGEGFGAVVGFLVGALLASVVWVFIVTNVDVNWRTKHREGVFQEQVDKHGCKVVSRWANGAEKKGDMCVLPDGTILQR